jgi:5-methylcytosine-specific restriction enzyme subunit McrC
MTSVITVYEHGLLGTAINIGETFSSTSRTITHRDAHKLEAFSNRHGIEPFRYVSPTKLIAQNYVGVVTLGNITIEVLPKIDNLSAQSIRHNLISMLAVTMKLDIKEIDIAKLSTQNLDLLEIIIRIFCDKFFAQLRKGIVRRYERREENLNLIKGKVISSINSRVNIGYPERLYCEFDEFQDDNPLNRLFKTTFRYLSRLSKDRTNQRRLSELIFAFDEVTDISVSEIEWNGIIIDRQSKRYNLLYNLSKLFLKRESTDVISGSQEGYSLLFDMNELFEEYIGLKCKALFKSEVVTLQSPKKYLLSDVQTLKGMFMTIPDISIDDRLGSRTIIDTKWKILDSEKDKDGVLQQDIYQMYAYAHNYMSRDVYLLYPHTRALSLTPGLNRRLKINNDNFEAFINIATVSLSDLATINDQLKHLLNYKNDQQLMNVA